MRGCIVHGVPTYGCSDCDRRLRATHTPDWRDGEIERLRAEVKRLQGQLDSHGIVWCQPQLREPTRAGHVCGLQGFGALGDVCPACETNA